VPISFVNKSTRRLALPLIVLPWMLAACATPPAATNTGNPAPDQEVNSNSSGVSSTSPPQQALIEAERKEDQREDEQSRKARVEREKNLHLKLVQTMVEQDNAYAALAHLDSYDQKWGADRPSKQLRADALRKTSQLDQAELVYKSLLGGKEAIKSGPAWYGLGKVSIERGDLKSATTRLEKSIQVDPLNINAYSDLGLVYLLEGQKEPAYNTLMKANQLASGDVKVMANLALWGLVYDDFNMAMDIADRLQWSDNIRNQVMSQANSIKRRFDAKGN